MSPKLKFLPSRQVQMACQECITNARMPKIEEMITLRKHETPPGHHSTFYKGVYGCCGQCCSLTTALSPTNNYYDMVCNNGDFVHYYRPRGSGSPHGNRLLDNAMASGRPVRYWYISKPNKEKHLNCVYYGEYVVRPHPEDPKNKVTLVRV